MLILGPRIWDIKIFATKCVGFFISFLCETNFPMSPTASKLISKDVKISYVFLMNIKFYRGMSAYSIAHENS